MACITKKTHHEFLESFFRKVTLVKLLPFGISWFARSEKRLICCLWMSFSMCGLSLTKPVSEMCKITALSYSKGLTSIFNHLFDLEKANGGKMHVVIKSEPR